MKASYKKHILQFKRPGGTSRGVLNTKETWFLKISDVDNWGVGECGLLRGLSIDDIPTYEEKLKWVCEHINLGEEKLMEALVAFPSIQMGLETAFLSLRQKDPYQLFPSAFTKGEKGIPINGLIWMGDKRFMHEQIEEKIKQGFHCIKMKIGAIDFETEIDLLMDIRKEFSAADIELRVDANGAFHTTEALEKLKRLSELDLHSIEQPIQPKQWEAMAALCEKTPLPIALDEELIGVFSVAEKSKLLKTIQPQYIILKPSLIGGFSGTDQWIALTKELQIGWWVTSALESNVGLNAIAQYTFTKNNSMPQGLGTGSLYTNNIRAPLEVVGENLFYNKSKSWEMFY
jgi:o-succinylbenzoate synthase